MGKATQAKRKRMTQAARTALPVLVTATVSALFPQTRSAWAQDAAVQASDAPHLTVLNELSSGIRTQSDLIAGDNKPGPYNLSWNNLRVSRDEKVTVVVDGTQLRNEEYTVDAAKGTITFGKPLGQTQVARISYIYDLNVSKRNGSIATSQFSLPVTRLAGAEFKVTALPNSANTAGALPLVWGANRKMNLLGGGLSAQFNMASGKGSGSQLGYALGNDRNGLKADFSRTERNFASSVGKSLNLNDAAQKWSLSTRLAPAQWLGLNFGTSENDDLTSDAEKGNENFGIRLGGTKSLPTLAYTRNEDTVEDAKKAETSVTVEKLALDTRIDNRTKVNAANTTTTTEAPTGGTDVTVKETAIALNSASKDNQKKADVSVNTGSKESKDGTEDKQDIKVRLQPGTIFAVTAGQSEQTVTPAKVDGKEGVAQKTLTQTAGAEISPTTNTKITGSFFETAKGDVHTSATDLAAQVGTGKRVEITGGVTNRSNETPNQTALDTTRAKVALKPWDTVTLTGSYVWNPEDQGVVKQALRQELGLTARLGALEFGSGYALTTLNGLKDMTEDPQFGEVSLSLGLRFNRATKLDGTYKDSLRYGMNPNVAAGLIPNYIKTYGLGFSHGLTDAFSFKLGGSISEDRSRPKDAKEMKAEAKLGVKF